VRRCGGEASPREMSGFIASAVRIAPHVTSDSAAARFHGGDTYGFRVGLAR
jgi:hypothetical protein